MNRLPPTNDHSWNRSSIPCRAMLASSGEIDPALRGSHFRGSEHLPRKYSRLQPALNHSAKDRCPGQDGLMVNFVEEALDVGIQDPAAACLLALATGTFASQTVFDRGRCIVHRSSWSETVGTRLEDRFPFRFQGQFDQALHHSIFQRGNAQRALFAVGLRDEHPSDRHWHVILQAETVLEQTFPISVGFTYDSVDAGSFPTAVLLTDLADCQEFRGPRGSQQTLQGLHPFHVAFDLGHEDSMLQTQNGLLDFLPVDLAPVERGLSSICVDGFPHRQHAFHS